uniref:OCIA domain-containing protein n=2 Tax=Scylla olivacea TaxID=85551 RepID=A0A0N7ZDL5_SCYOL
MALQGGQGRHGGQDDQFKPVFTQEELRVLRECNRESFYFRSVPLAAAFSTATAMALRKGILSASSRFGYTPKIIGAVAAGYFIGKLSYQNACAEKIMQLPNSPLAEALRRRKGRIGFQETLGMEAGFTVGPTQTEAETPAEPIFDDHRPDLRDHNEGLDDYHRGVTESLSPYTDQPAAAAPPPTSYQELRRKNREDYVNRMAERYRRPSLGEGPQDIPPVPPPAPPAPPSNMPMPVRKNQYGDDVYE